MLKRTWAAILATAPKDAAKVASCPGDGLWFIQLFVVTEVFQDDLPSISVSRLRASGVITAEMSKAKIGIANVEVEVGLQLVKFANGGSWSFFLCPQCGRRARTLKLLEGCVLCWGCCHRRGVRYRVSSAMGGRPASCRRRSSAVCLGPGAARSRSSRSQYFRRS